MHTESTYRDTQEPKRTTAQRAWDFTLNHTVPKLDRLGEAVGAFVSRFTQDEWGVHFQFEAWRPAFTDAWAERGDGDSAVYFLHLGRVEFAVFRSAAS